MSRAKSRRSPAKWIEGKSSGKDTVQPLAAHGVIGLVCSRDRTRLPNPADQYAPQKVAGASLAAVESHTPLGEVIRGPGRAKLFDRSSWVMRTWYPFVPCDRGARPVWPNSPPLPKPAL